MKKVLVALPYAVSIRDFVHSGCLQRLLDRSRIRIKIYTLNPDLPEFDEIRRSGVEIVTFAPYADNRVERLVKGAYVHVFADKFVHVQQANASRPLHRAAGGVLSWLRRTLGTRPFLAIYGALLLALHRARRLPPALDADADLFIGTRSLVNSIDYGLTAEAATKHLPVLTIAGSWDNFTTKGFFPFATRSIVVWNEKMKQELMDLFGVEAERICVAGYSRAQLLRTGIGRESAEEYLVSIGITGYRRFVLYGASYGELTRVAGRPVPLEYSTVEHICRRLAEALPEDVCILIRLHPYSHDKDIAVFAGLDRCFVYVPGKSDEYVERVMNLSDEQHLASQIGKSVCVISMASTISIDSACLKQPIVNVDFDYDHTIPTAQSIRRFYHFNHFADLVRISNLPLARSYEEVEVFVRACLDSSYCSPVDYAAFETMYVPDDSALFPDKVRSVVESITGASAATACSHASRTA